MKLQTFGALLLMQITQKKDQMAAPLQNERGTELELLSERNGWLGLGEEEGVNL